MMISDRGLALLKVFEGFRPEIYPDQAGLPTIGYGHLLTTREKALGTYARGLNEEQASTLLRGDVGIAELTIEQTVKCPLNQNQFDALVSFVFNIGGVNLVQSRMLKYLNKGKYTDAAGEFVKWRKVHNPKTGLLEDNEGLLARRKREAALFEAP